jgi:hypothetical protein
MPVGQREGELDARVQTSGVVALVEPVGVVGQGPAGGTADVGGHQSERQRQVPAAGRDAG